MQVFTITQHSTAKEIPRLTRHTATLIQFYFEPTGASHSHLHKPNEKKMGVATSLGASSLSATASPESLRRGARSSCLHVHASIARVARGWDPRLPNMRLLRDPVHHASLKHPTKLRHSSESSPRTTLSDNSVQTLSGQPPDPHQTSLLKLSGQPPYPHKRKTLSQSFLPAV